MLFRFAVRSAGVISVMMALSTGAFSAPIVPEAGNCIVNATAWKIPNSGTLTTTSQSPIAVPNAGINFTMAAAGCAVVQVTADALSSGGGQLLLYFVLDGAVISTQSF